MSEQLQEILNNLICGINMDYNRKESLFYLVKRTKNPSELIQEVKQMSWMSEDKEDIEKFIKNIKKTFNHRN